MKKKFISLFIFILSCLPIFASELPLGLDIEEYNYYKQNCVTLSEFKSPHHIILKKATDHDYSYVYSLEIQLSNKKTAFYPLFFGFDSDIELIKFTQKLNDHFSKTKTIDKDTLYTWMNKHCIKFYKKSFSKEIKKTFENEKSWWVETFLFFTLNTAKFEMSYETDNIYSYGITSGFMQFMDELPDKIDKFFDSIIHLFD